MVSTDRNEGQDDSIKQGYQERIAFAADIDFEEVARRTDAQLKYHNGKPHFLSWDNNRVTLMWLQEKDERTLSFKYNGNSHKGMENYGLLLGEKEIAFVGPVVIGAEGWLMAMGVDSNGVPFELMGPEGIFSPRFINAAARSKTAREETEDLPF